MNMATSRPSPGLQRANLRTRAPAPAPREETSFAAAPRAAAAPAPSSALRDVSDVVVGVALILGMLVALLCLASYTRDSVAIGKALSEQDNAHSSMICKDGRIARGDGSIPDIVFEDGVFICTDWRTQQGVELEQSQKGRRY